MILNRCYLLQKIEYILYHIHTFSTQEDLLNDLTNKLLSHIQEILKKQSTFSVSLAGGSTPRALYHLWTTEPWLDQFPWDQMRWYFGDERTVPPDHVDSNFRMAQEALFTPLGISDSNIFRMQGEIDPVSAALLYENNLRETLPGEQLDFILLGLGDDGHTASLFPYTDILKEDQAWVRSTYVPNLSTHRISLTAPFINSASQIVFLVMGSGKADAVRQVIHQESSPEKFPAQLIRPHSDNVHWYLDTEAAGQL